MNAASYLSAHEASLQPKRLLLRCPACGSSMGRAGQKVPLFETAVACARCSFQLEHSRGIWLAIPPDRAEHFKRFAADYQKIRASEGRGSTTADYYLSLPFRDTTGKNQGQWKIRTQTYRYLEQQLLPMWDREGKGLDILDLGAGNGWLSYRLAALGHHPVAIDLLINDEDGLGAASHYLQKLEILFPRFQALLDRLPLENGQFDVAIFNASFHYSEDYAKTLAESIRCLRPGGFVVIADTPWYAKEESGKQMLRERRAAFQQRYGFPSDGLNSLEFLTDRRLHDLEKRFGIDWQVHHPSYGLSWAMRPLIAKLKRRREPSKFRIYVAEVTRP